MSDRLSKVNGEQRSKKIQESSMEGEDDGRREGSHCGTILVTSVTLGIDGAGQPISRYAP